MKVVCINSDLKDEKFLSDFSGKLEIGKVYEGDIIFNIDGVSDYENNYLTINGFGIANWFPTKNFITLEEWREKQLDRLL